MDIKQLVIAHRDAESNYHNARVALAVIVEFTVLNIVNMLVNNQSLFAFSISGAYIAAGLGVLYESALSMCLGLMAASAVIASYIVCFFMSKKNSQFMNIGFCIFAADVALLFYRYFTVGYSGIVDIILHLFVFGLLALGVYGGYQLKTLPPLPPEQTAQEDFSQESQPLCPLPFKRNKIIVKAQAAGHSVCYRRIKKYYELVVDGNIYARSDFQIDRHSVSVRVNSNLITAGFDGVSKFYICVNDEKVAQKIRFW